MNASFLIDRITATRALIIAYEDALLALASGVQSYKLNTGQTDQVVTKLDLTSLNNTVASLYNRCATLEARLNGSGTTTVVPAW